MMRWPPDYLKMVDYRARCHVNGSKYHELLKRVEPLAGKWSRNFEDHPWVKQAETEGWGRDLRAHVIAQVKNLILRELPFDDVTALMPDQKWVDYAREQALKASEAKAWQQTKEDAHGTFAQYLETKRLPDVSRKAFDKFRSLSVTTFDGRDRHTKRITGDRS